MTQRERGSEGPLMPGLESVINQTSNMLDITMRIREHMIFAADTADPKLRDVALGAVAGLIEAQQIINGQRDRLGPVSEVMTTRRAIMRLMPQPSPKPKQGGKQ